MSKSVLGCQNLSVMFRSAGEPHPRVARHFAKNGKIPKTPSSSTHPRYGITNIDYVVKISGP
jgi:hypothetical protein